MVTRVTSNVSSMRLRRRHRRSDSHRGLWATRVVAGSHKRVSSLRTLGGLPEARRRTADSVRQTARVSVEVNASPTRQFRTSRIRHVSVLSRKRLAERGAPSGRCNRVHMAWLIDPAGADRPLDPSVSSNLLRQRCTPRPCALWGRRRWPDRRVCRRRHRCIRHIGCVSRQFEVAGRDPNVGHDAKVVDAVLQALARLGV